MANWQGVTGWIEARVTTKGEMFDRYIETQLAPTLRAGDVVILDNLSSHKSPGAAQTLREVGAWFLFRCSGKTPRWGLF